MNRTDLIESLKGLIFFPIFVLISYSAKQEGVFSNLLQMFSFVAIVLPFALFGFFAFVLNTLALITFSVFTSKAAGDFSSTVSAINFVVQICSVFSVFVMYNLGRKKLNISFLAPISVAILIVACFITVSFLSNTGSVATDFINFLNTTVNQQVVDVFNANKANEISKKDLIDVAVLFFPSFAILSFAIMFTVSYYIAFLVASYVNKNLEKETYNLDTKARYVHNIGFLGFGVLALITNNLIPSGLESSASISNFKYFIYTTTISYFLLYIIPGTVVFVDFIKKNILYILITVIVSLFVNVLLLVPITILGILYSFGIIAKSKN